MDEELKAALEAMEKRLTTRLSTNHGIVLERFRSVEARLGSLETNMQTVVLLLTDFAKRITDLEKKP